MLAHGHYTGSTSQDEPISFDVGDEDAAVTNIVARLQVRAASGRAVVMTITQRFPLDGTGRFGGALRGRGLRGSIEGWIDPAGNGSGALEVDLDGAPGMPPALMSTGSVLWRARRVTGVLPTTF